MTPRVQQAGEQRLPNQTEADDLPQLGPPAARPARVGLVATDAMRIMGLRAILGDGQECDIVVLGASADFDGAGCGLVIIDSSTAGVPSAQVFELLALGRRARPQPAMIVLGAETDMAHIERVIAAGAKGYLSHSASEADLRMAIAVVRDGSVWAPRKVLARLLEEKLDQPPVPVPTVQFTRREIEVLSLLVQGHPNRQIAAALGVDEGTVKAHMGRLMRKAGVDNRTALSMRAIERHWA